MTNFDQITRTVDGLAYFLLDMVRECEIDCPIYDYCCTLECDKLECDEVWIKWLLEDC